MIPPASWRRALRLSHTKIPMKNRNGSSDSRSASRLEVGPTPVTATWCALSVGASDVSLSASRDLARVVVAVLQLARDATVRVDGRRAHLVRVDLGTGTGCSCTSAVVVLVIRGTKSRNTVASRPITSSHHRALGGGGGAGAGWRSRGGPGLAELVKWRCCMTDLPTLCAVGPSVTPCSCVLAPGRLTAVQVYLIDGTYELFRQFFGRPASAADDGTEMGATRGVLWSVASLLVPGRHPYRGRHRPRHRVVPQRPMGRLQDGRRGATRAQVPVSRCSRRRSSRSGCGSGRWSSSRPTTPSRRRQPWPRTTRGSIRSLICTPDKDLAQCVVGRTGRPARPPHGGRHRRRRRPGALRGRPVLDPRLAGSRRRQRRRLPGACRLGPPVGVGGARPLRPYRRHPGRLSRTGTRTSAGSCGAPRSSPPDWPPSASWRCCSASSPRSGSTVRCSAAWTSSAGAARARASRISAATFATHRSPTAWRRSPASG